MIALVVVVEQLGLVAVDDPTARTGFLLVESIRQEDVQRLGRADAVEHGEAEPLGAPALEIGRERLAGGDTGAHRAERRGVDVGVEDGGDEPGHREEQRRRLRGDELADRRRRRPLGVEDHRGTRTERERERVAEPVGEEQLGDRQEPVGGRDPEHRAGIRVVRRLHVAVGVHDALRQPGGARRVQPERRRIRGGVDHRHLAVVGVRRPPLDVGRSCVDVIRSSASSTCTTRTEPRADRTGSTTREVLGRHARGRSPRRRRRSRRRRRPVSIVEIGTATTPLRMHPRIQAIISGESFITITTRSSRRNAEVGERSLHPPGQALHCAVRSRPDRGTVRRCCPPIPPRCGDRAARPPRCTSPWSCPPDSA